MTLVFPEMRAEALPGPFLGFAADTDSRRVIGMAAAARGWPHPTVREGGLEMAHAALATDVPPAFLVVDISADRAPLPAMDRLADLAPEGLKVIAVGTRNDVALFRGLRALGVADYLLKPLDPELLGAAIDAAMGDALAAPIAPHEAQRARMIAFVGSRGGAGASTLAAATAALLSGGGASVVLADFDFQMGTQALDLETDGFAGLQGLFESPDRLDPQVAGQALKAHSLGFRLLAGDVALETPLAIEPDAALALLAAAGEGADNLVVDLPRCLDRTQRAIIRTADTVVIVTQPTLAGLRDTGRLMALAGALRAGAQPLVVVNRAGEAAAELPRQSFEHILGAPVHFWLKADRRAAHAAARRGTALSECAGPALSAGLRALAGAVASPSLSQVAEARSLGLAKLFRTR